MRNALMISLLLVPISSLIGQISSYPYMEDFESYASCNSSCPAICTLNNGWSNSNDDDTDWIVFSGNTPTLFTGPSQDKIPGTSQGKYVVIESSEGCHAGTEAILISPIFDLQNLSQPILEFWYHQFGNGQGTIHIDVDTSAGWEVDYFPVLKGDNPDWQRMVTCLDKLAGQDWVQFRLRGITGITDQSDMAIDGFQIREARNNDVFLKDIQVDACGLNAQAQVSIVYGNLGKQIGMNLVASYSIDNGPFSASELIPGQLLACDSGLYTFNALANLALPGTHTITAVVSLFSPIDQNPQNDTLRIQVNSIPKIDVFPYEESFEHSPGGWTGTGQNSSWAWGTPMGSHIQTAGDGAKAWITNLNGAHNNNEYSFLESPCLDFSALQVDPVLSFMHTFQLEEELDLCWVEYSVDGGNLWERLGNRSNGLANWYNSRWQDAWTGESSSGGLWNEAAFLLTGTAGKVVRVRFVILSDGSIREEGVGIDQIKVVYPYDIAVVEVLAPGDTCGSVRGTEEVVSIKVKNQGYHNLSNIAVTFRVDAGGVFVPNETISGQLRGGESKVHVFQSHADLSTMGHHYVVAAAILGGDNDFQNNIMVRNAGNYPLPQFDLGKDTLLCGNESMDLDPQLSGLEYHWNTGDTSQTLSVQSGGEYILHLTDAHGCENQDSITINFMPVLQPLFSYVEHVSCYGDNNGEFQMKPKGGIGNYHLIWDSGDTLSTRTQLPAGTYHFVLKDDAGCELRDSVKVRQPDSLSIEIDEVQNASCPVDSTGFIHVSIAGGTAPYNYLWSNGKQTEDITRLPEGNYYLSLVDENGCGKFSDKIEIVTADTMPKAHFSYVVSGGTVQFFNTSLNAHTYSWSFGDGAPIVFKSNPSYTYDENGFYQVKLIAINSCGIDTLIQSVLLNTVGIGNKTPEISLLQYPNPLIDRIFYLEGQGQALEEVKLQVVDLQGRIIFRQSWSYLSAGFKEKFVLPSHTSQGMYLLTVNSKQGTYRRRLLLK